MGEIVDPVEEMQNDLFELRTSRINQLNAREVNEASTVLEVVNKTIADVMNLMENLYIVVNAPKDGFVSITPERPSGQQED